MFDLLAMFDMDLDEFVNFSSILAGLLILLLALTWAVPNGSI
ncbi:hypothetical protein [Methanosarcina sp. UBA289]|nr:hypothetical protein [Methanosarcina sp. UBA289]